MDLLLEAAVRVLLGLTGVRAYVWSRGAAITTRYSQQRRLHHLQPRQCGLSSSAPSLQHTDQLVGVDRISDMTVCVQQGRQPRGQRCGNAWWGQRRPPDTTQACTSATIGGTHAHRGLAMRFLLHPLPFTPW